MLLRRLFARTCDWIFYYLFDGSLNKNSYKIKKKVKIMYMLSILIIQLIGYIILFPLQETMHYFKNYMDVGTLPC